LQKETKGVPSLILLQTRHSICFCALWYNCEYVVRC